MTETNPPHNARFFRKGEFLFRENENSRDVYIVNSGRVRVFKMEGGIEIELDTIGPGGVIGEIAAVDGGDRSASVLAVEDTNAFVITPEEFAGITGKIPEWLHKISSILAHRLREADARINCNLEPDKTPHVAAAISLITYSGMCAARGSEFEITAPLTLTVPTLVHARVLQGTQWSALLEINAAPGSVPWFSGISANQNNVVLEFPPPPASPTPCSGPPNSPRVGANWWIFRLSRPTRW